MTSTVLLSGTFLFFVGKIFFCGLLGFLILGLIQAFVELKVNPNGWKFGKEYFNPEDDTNEEKPEEEIRLNYQPVIRQEQPLKRHDV